MSDKPTTFMLRPDEALAVLYVLSGALWLEEIRLTMRGRAE
jgi:hypothetical protein